MATRDFLDGRGVTPCEHRMYLAEVVLLQTILWSIHRRIHPPPHPSGSAAVHDETRVGMLHRGSRTYPSSNPTSETELVRPHNPFTHSLPFILRRQVQIVLTRDAALRTMQSLPFSLAASTNFLSRDESVRLQPHPRPL